MNRRAAVAIFLFTWTLTMHGKYSASGDEPHYLMITHSLVADHDLDVANNYAEDDGRFVGHEHLEMELHALPARNGHIRPVHGVGIAILLVPIYVIAQQAAGLPSDAVLTRVRMTRGLLAYSIVSLFLVAVTAFGLFLLADALSYVAPQPAAALLVVAAGVSPPIVSHSFLVFPEVLALFVTSLVVWLSLRPAGADDRRPLFAILFALGALPWAHQKYLLYVPGLLFVLASKRWPLIRSLSTTERLIASTLVLVPQLTLLVWTWREWGTFAGALASSGLPFSTHMLTSGLMGLWVDRQSGLLAYAPLYWIVPACWYLTWRTTWPFLVPFALLYVPAASFVEWWAGFSPAARYLVPAIPFFIVITAHALRYRAIRVFAFPLLAFQVVIDGVVWQHPRTLWPSPQGNLALQMLDGIGRAYETALPAAQTGLPFAVAIAIGAFAVTLTAVLIALSVAGARHAGLAHKIGGA
jgi:hypothetical protein